MGKTATKPTKATRPISNRVYINLAMDPDILAAIDALPFGLRPEKINKILRDSLTASGALA